MKYTTTTDTGLELAKWLGGVAAGALLMYMLDPDRGSTRRAQSVAAVRGAGSRLGAAADDVRDSAADALASDKADGAADKIGSTMSRLGQAAGDVLDDTMSKAKSAFGRGSDSASDMVDQASRSASRIKGRVASAWRESASGPDAWNPTLRNSALLGGGLLALTGLMRRSPLGLVLGLAGAALLARGATNQSLRSLVANRGMGMDQPIDLEKTIHIDASPEEVYDLFANYENFPRFMSHVAEVRDLGGRRSHWTVKGPGGSEFEWNSVLTEQSRPHRLAWRSEPGAEIPQTGSIQLEPHRGGTDVTVRMSYTPPAGVLGHGLATLLGADPRSQMDEDLARMKAYIERGSVPGSSAQPRSGSRFLH